MLAAILGRSTERKRALATFTIDNNGTLAELEYKVLGDHIYRVVI